MIIFNECTVETCLPGQKNKPSRSPSNTGSNIHRNGSTYALAGQVLWPHALREAAGCGCVACINMKKKTLIFVAF